MSSSNENERYGSHVRNIARGAGVSSLGQGVGRILSYATQLAVARLFGPAQLGYYVIGYTMIYLANILAQVGMDIGVTRFVSRYRAEGDVSRVRGTILLALWTTFGLSIVLAGMLFFGAGFLAIEVYEKPFVEPILKIFAVSLPPFTLMNMTVFALGGFQTEGGAHKHGTSVRQVLQPLINLLLVALFYVLGAEVLGAAVAYVISMVAGSVLGLYYLRRVFPGLLDRRIPPNYEPRELFKVSGPMIVAGFTLTLTPWASVTILGIFATAEAVGVYQVAARTAALSTLVLFAFSGIFSPMISGLYSRGSMEVLSSLYKDVSRWTFTGSLVVFLLTALLARDIMAVFGAEFVSGWAAMVFIAAAYLFSSSVGHTGRILAMTGHQKVVMLSTVGAAVVGVAMNFALVPFYGYLGAAAATSASIVFANVYTLLAVKRLLGLWPYDRAYNKPVVAGLFAVAGVYLAKLVLPLPLGLISLLVVTPVFLVLFAALLIALGLSETDRQFLGTIWKGVVRRVRRGEARTT